MPGRKKHIVPTPDNLGMIFTLTWTSSVYSIGHSAWVPHTTWDNAALWQDWTLRDFGGVPIRHPTSQSWRYYQFLSYTYQPSSCSIQHERHKQPHMGQRRPGTELPPSGLGRRPHQSLSLPRHTLHVLTHFVTRSFSLTPAFSYILTVQLFGHVPVPSHCSHLCGEYEHCLKGT